jgi:hypothetical protein
VKFVFFWFIPAIICSTLTASPSTLQNYDICSAANVPGLPDPKDEATMTLKKCLQLFTYLHGVPFQKI